MRTKVKLLIKPLILSLLFLLLLPLLSGCSSGFLSSRISKEDIIGATFLYQTVDTEVSLTLPREHPAFEYLLDYLNSPYEQRSLPEDKYAADPLLIIAI